MKISYNWLKWYIPEIPDAKKVADVFTYHLTEVEGIEEKNGDIIFDLNILPNRAHDLLSHLGVARELAGQLGIAFNDPTPKYKIPESQPTTLCVDIQTDACRRYSARIVRGVKVGPSPEWVVVHLASIGQRSINNIVDATNIVLFDCGQPTHAFDKRFIVNDTLTITTATDGEELPVLGREGIVAKLKTTDMVIASGGTTLALAGVKGGMHSGVSEETIDIVLEVANFAPTAVRKTARRLNLLSDAAKRFENDLSAELVPYGMRELSALIAEMCPEAVFEEIVDVYPQPQQERSITFTTDLVNATLGSTIRSDEIQKIFMHYRQSHVWTGEDAFEVPIPPLRLDLVIPEDIVEEIGRIYGYDKVVPQAPAIVFTPKENETHTKITAAREQLLADGYSEVMTYSFASKGQVEVLASASDKKFLRTNLSDGLKASYEMNKLNAPLLGMKEIKLFQIGTVFIDGKEEMHVATADKKGIVETSLAQYQTTHLDLNSNHLSDSINQKFSLWSPYPFIVRDVAVWVPETVTADAVMQIVDAHKGTLVVRGPELFDSFTKEGRTSYAFRLVFQSYEKTLDDAEIEPVMQSIYTALRQAGWEIR